MPCFNERATVREAVKRVLESRFTGELIIVDDGSTDGGLTEVPDTDERVRLVRQDINRGKGAAVRRGFAEARFPYVIVHDADLEIDPADWDSVLEPLVDGRADVVYGSRFLSGRVRRVGGFRHYLGNRLLTTASNMATNLSLTDMETCCKAFRREVVQSIVIEEDRFGFEPEITAKVASGDWEVYEVAISYYARTRAEGKKIGWRDGTRALYCIARYSPAVTRFRRRVRPRNRSEH